MAEINFKATRRKHDSGFRVISKSGDLQYDADPYSNDGIWLLTKEGSHIFIDCDYATGVFSIKFKGEDMRGHN